MDILTRKKFEELINSEEEWCISIYMPTCRMGADIKQNPIRYKQCIREAEDKLFNMGLSKSEVEKILQSASNLIDETTFWQNQTEGLVVFITPDKLNYYHLPFEVKDQVVISDKFYTKPLLPLFTTDGKFYILALSKNEVRLFKASRQMVKEIIMEDAPRSVEDMKVDDDPRTKLQIRTANPISSSSLSYNTASQGQAVENDFDKNELARYFRAIDESLNKLHKGEEIPLVLAGVEYLIPIYKEISKYPNIVEEFIKGNPEILYGDDLQKMAWEIMEPKFLKIQELAEAKYNQFSGQKNGLYSNSLIKILSQAYNGQIETLFIADGIHQWGRFNPNNSKVVFDEEQNIGNEDLIDRAATLTVSRGGIVYVVEPDKVPDGGTVAAVLRY
ncbi:hypothetical protein SAMN02745784_00059 [Tissierella praeacuta DSM 18095]|uniref:Bacterial archaeo-eukaryotic release factor family 6 domain-containing protein n=1 Tax=Tissierella praeacuta DSM 18095 TaxID=1123404 RepID=A0A1M4S5R0_9FIRM|nr:hypothetical protein [Tissierella praeacuta]SHE27531.1 hypothetical protein SAMN02745784_00059 [Tissierella praeacuta DSM 18095]SUP00916.1 Uncharacterised protein [Tissierella praeacuta]